MNLTAPIFAKPPNSERLTGERLADALTRFCGTQKWFRHWLVSDMLYTEGVRFFAEQGGEEGAYWFLDIVATEYFPMLRQEPFLAIGLTSENGKAAISVEDLDGRTLKEKKIEFTDLQPGHWPFYLKDNVLLLPGEY